MVSAVTKWVIAIFIAVFIIPTIVTFFIVSKGTDSFDPNLIGTLAIIIGIIIPLILVCGLFYWIFTFQKKREKDLMKYASELGLSYGSDEGEQIFGEIKNFEIFSKGILPAIWHMIKGKWSGIPVVVLDYSYKAGTIQNRVNRYQTIAYAKVKNANYKRTKIEKDGFTFETEGDKIIGYKRSYYIKPKELRNFLDKIVENIKAL